MRAFDEGRANEGRGPEGVPERERADVQGRDEEHERRPREDRPLSQAPGFAGSGARRRRHPAPRERAHDCPRTRLVARRVRRERLLPRLRLVQAHSTLALRSWDFHVSHLVAPVWHGFAHTSGEN